MRIGLFGGSFDPPHNGHLALALGCAKELGLDRVVLMPSAASPHKLKSGGASGEQRLAMCRLLADGQPLLTVSDWEIAQGGASFTVNTLEHLTASQPQDEWFLLTGADMFLTLPTWYRYPDITAMCTLCGIARDGADTAKLQAAADKMTAGGAKTAVLPVEAPTVSSTAIRDGVAAGDDRWKALLPEAVAAYIEAEGLYQGDGTADADRQYTEILRQRLSPYRFAHSLAVAKEAARLADKYGADRQKAYTAGLLHDILKDASSEEQMLIAEQFGVQLDHVEKQAPKLWHARLAPVFLENILGLTDEDILGAVRYHTTAKAGMTLLETIVFLADFTAEGRDYPDVAVMRRLVDESIDLALHYSLSYTVRSLTEKGAAVHPDTAAALAEVTARLQQKGELV